MPLYYGGAEKKKAGDIMLNAIKPGRLFEFMTLGLPGGLMLAVESSSFEITTAMAGILGMNC